MLCCSLGFVLAVLSSIPFLFSFLSLVVALPFVFGALPLVIPRRWGQALGSGCDNAGLQAPWALEPRLIVLNDVCGDKEVAAEWNFTLHDDLQVSILE